ncbi:NHL repeat-containing protein [Spirosoma areae]
MKHALILYFIAILGVLTAGCSKKADAPTPVTPPTSTTTTVPPSSTTTVAPSSTTTATGITAIVTTLAGNGDEGYVDGIGAAARFKNPSALVCDLADNIYVVDLNNGRIRRVSPTGSVTTLAGSGAVGVTDGTGTTATFYLAGGTYVSRDIAGNLLIAENSTVQTSIRRVTPAGVVSTLTTIPIGIGTPVGFYGLATAANGDLYISDGNAIRLFRNGNLSIFAGGTRGYANGTLSMAQFNNPNALAFDADGNLYVGDENACIRKITPAGVVSLLAGQPGVSGIANGKGSAATFRNITSLVADKQGNLYVADNTLIRRVTPDGTVTTIAGSGTGYTDGTGTAARFRDIRSITIDSKGVLYVADLPNQAIRKIVVQ